MSGFEFNKLAASVLVAMIVGMVAGMLAEGLVHPQKLEKASYPIAADESAAPEQTAAGPAPEKPAPLTPEILAKADPAAGEAQSKKCAACHTFDKGGANRVGPNLWGVIGRARATEAGFAYSDAMKKVGGNWTAQDIAAFIFNPKLFVPGTKMGFAGLPKASDRADVLAFLNQHSDAPTDLSKAQ